MRKKWDLRWILERLHRIYNLKRMRNDHLFKSCFKPVIYKEYKLQLPPCRAKSRSLKTTTEADLNKIT